MAFAKAQTTLGALYDSNGNLAGTVQVKVGKKSRAGVVKISATVTLMNGKKVNSKSLSLNVDKGEKSGKLVFAGIGTMDFEMADDGTFTLGGGNYAMANAKVGGNLPNGKKSFKVDFDALPAVGAGFEILGNLLPGDAEVNVVGGKKLDAGKAALIKYAKDKTSGTFALVGFDDPKKPNLSGLKLTYTPKTGMFKGSFNIYATNESVTSANKSPKLKKLKVNITGFFVDGGDGFVGVGEAKMKTPAASWAVTIR